MISRLFRLFSKWFLMNLRNLFLSVFLCLLLACPTVRLKAQIEHSMQLVAPQTGWVLQDDRLFWTTDNGQHWADITPQNPLSREIAWVFFLNPSSGWVLFTVKDADKVAFDLASTSDSGADWAIIRIYVANLDPDQDLAGDGRFNFTDTTHGWLNLGLGGSSNANPGVTLKTNDGGRTWTLVKSLPMGRGSLRFIDGNNGWATDHRKLFATRDSGTSWQLVSLPTPSQAQRATHATYQLPTFAGPKNGVLALAHYGPDSKSAMVLFATTDGGQTWRVDRVLLNLPDVSPDAPFPNTLVDSTWIVAATPPHNGELTLTKVGPGGAITKVNGAFAGMQYLGTPSNTGGISALSFKSATSGWATVACCGTRTNFLSTIDGGATWINITPPHNPFAWVQPSSRDIMGVCSNRNPPPCATPPLVIQAPDPVYAEEARLKKVQGTSVLWLIVGTDGHAHDIHVARTLGYGLDEEAINAVRKWRFKPSTLNGTPVPVQINVEIKFRLFQSAQ